MQNYKFCQDHPNLENLNIAYYRHPYLADVPFDAVCKLHKLESFTCYRAISKGAILFQLHNSFQKHNLIHLYILYRFCRRDGRGLSDLEDSST